MSIKQLFGFLLILTTVVISTIIIVRLAHYNKTRGVKITPAGEQQLTQDELNSLKKQIDSVPHLPAVNTNATGMPPDIQQNLRTIQQIQQINEINRQNRGNKE